MAIFTRTCEDVDLVTCIQGTQHIDPCNCSAWYACGIPRNTEMLSHTCTGNTQYDVVIQNCNYIDVIEGDKCDPRSPWVRCNVSESREAVLQQMCTGTNTTFTTTPTSTPTISSSSSSTTPRTEAASPPSGGNIGLTVGLIVGGIIIVLFVGIVIFILYRRRKGKLLDRRPTQTNPEYFEGNDPYATIDDSMNFPVYNHGGSDVFQKPPLPGSRISKSSDVGDTSTRSSILSGDTLGDMLAPTAESVEYDNSGVTRESLGTARKTDSGYITFDTEVSGNSTRGISGTVSAEELPDKKVDVSQTDMPNGTARSTDDTESSDDNRSSHSIQSGSLSDSNKENGDAQSSAQL